MIILFQFGRRGGSVPFHYGGEAAPQASRVEDVIDLGQVPQLLGVVGPGLQHLLHEGTGPQTVGQ